MKNRFDRIEQAMVTGDSLFTGLVVVAMMLSLAPILIIFVRKVYHHAILNLLRVVCLFVFFQYLVLSIPGLLPADLTFIKAGFQLGEFILLLYVLKRMMAQKRMREFLNIFLVAFVSVVITMYFLKKIDTYPLVLSLLQSAILVVLSIAILIQLIGDNDIILFREPLFWVAGGILCYSSMILFMQYVLAFQPNISGKEQFEKDLVLGVANIARLVLFTVAALTGSKKGV